MAHSPSLLNAKSEFDDFLYAPVGEDVRGTVVSVLSALARLDFDPWQQAADIALLPRDVAKNTLAAMIEKLPGMAQANSAPDTIAARLVALLPSGKAAKLSRSSIRSEGSVGDAMRAGKLGYPRNTAIIMAFLAISVIVQVILATQTSSQSDQRGATVAIEAPDPSIQPAPTAPVTKPVSVNAVAPHQVTGK